MICVLIDQLVYIITCMCDLWKYNSLANQSCLKYFHDFIGITCIFITWMYSVCFLWIVKFLYELLAFHFHCCGIYIYIKNLLLLCLSTAFMIVYFFWESTWHHWFVNFLLSQIGSNNDRLIRIAYMVINYIFL